MPEADPKDAATEEKRGLLSPARSFLLLLGLIVLIALAVILTRPDAPEAPPPNPVTQEPDFSLTNAEALTRFKALDELRRAAYESRDLSLLPHIYSDESRVERIARREITLLLRRNILDRSSEETLSLDVLANTGTEIEIEQRVIVRPRFIRENGKNLTVNSAPIRRVNLVTLRLADGAWLIFDALTKRAQRL